MMGEYFQTLVNMNNILFEGWSTSSTGDVVLASFITFLFTFVFEGLKAVKMIIVARRTCNPMSDPTGDQTQETETTEPEAELLSSLRIPSSLDQIKVEKTKLFIVESLLHTLTFAYAYLIMLVVMTYSVWFLLAVILGSGLGFWVSNPIGQHFAQLYLPRQCETKDCNFQNLQNIETVDSSVMTVPPHTGKLFVSILSWLSTLARSFQSATHITWPLRFLLFFYRGFFVCFFLFQIMSTASASTAASS